MPMIAVQFSQITLMSQILYNRYINQHSDDLFTWVRAHLIINVESETLNYFLCIHDIIWVIWVKFAQIALIPLQ